MVREKLSRTKKNTPIVLGLVVCWAKLLARLLPCRVGDGPGYAIRSPGYPSQAEKPEMVFPETESFPRAASRAGYAANTAATELAITDDRPTNPSAKPLRMIRLITLHLLVICVSIPGS